MPTVPPPNLQDLVLLRPIAPTDELVVSPRWLMVSDSMISFDGRTCDKIGVGYSAFQYQSSKCDIPAGSCLNNQIKQLLSVDDTRESQGKDPLYRVSRFVSIIFY